eukprot:GGOE01037279.1.p1 GENE.GGOE01037279.1~~GGOE01037279.1.p1  ORF type:complete len:296 (+),score=68.46 GGOE01037279.1:51-938(+)
MDEKEMLMAQAKTWQQVGRTMELCQIMLRVASLDVELLSEERLLLALACQRVRQEKRRALTTLSTALHKAIEAITHGRCSQSGEGSPCLYCGRMVPADTGSGCDGRLIFRGSTKPPGDPEQCRHLILVQGYTMQTAKHLLEWIKRLLSVFDAQLERNCPTAEARVFFLKMKGDYYSHCTEIFTGLFDDDAHHACSQHAEEAYQASLDLAAVHLPATHVTRLSVALNYAVFLHEALGATVRAMAIARQAMEDIQAESNPLLLNQEANLTLFLLHDNAAHWAALLDPLGSGSKVSGG